MSCLKKTIIGFGIFFSVLLSAFFVSPSYAINDLSITIDSNSSINRGDLVFPNCDSVCFDQYSYLIFEPLSYELFSTSSYRLNFYVSGYGNKTFDLPTLSTSFVSLASFYDNILFYNSVPSGFSFKITLTESLPNDNCPVCETCPVCPAIPENPYDNKLDNITMAIYTCGGILLVLYFFYCIYRIIIRNSGVDKV